MSAVYTIIILALFALGMPVAFVLMLGGVLGMLFFLGGPAAFTQIPVIAYKTLDDFVLVAVPLYILMSEILLKGKVGNGLFELGSKWLGHLPGGIGVATIFACAIFAAISGSSVATAVTIGAMAIPEMLKRGYERTTVLGAVAAGGTLGILIPPSIPMILYGSITGESVGKLFLSGIVPGVLMTFFFICYLVFRCRHMERQAAASWQERWAILKENIWGLFLPILVVGGIYTGLFTPTEAAAVGTFYSLIITFFVYRTVKLRDMGEILTDTVKTTSMIFAINDRRDALRLHPDGAAGTAGADGTCDGRAGQPLARLHRHQHRAPGPRLRPRDGLHHPHHAADALPNRQVARLRPHLVQRRHAHQHGAGPHNAAGRHEPLRHQGHQPR